MGVIKKVLANVLQSLTAGEMATARNNIDAQQKLVVGDGLKLTGNNLKADVVKIQPWKYFNHYVPSENWTSKVHAGTCDLDSADIDSGIIKIPFDNVQWPFTDTSLQYCLCTFTGVQLYKAVANPALAGQVWNGDFETAKTRISDRYDYNNDVICDFSWTWNSEGSFTDYRGGWSFIMDMNPRGTDSYKNLEFDFRNYRQYLADGDRLFIHGMIWPLSLKVFNYTS